MGADLILASSSPRRIKMLRAMGIDIDVIPSHVDEDYMNGERPKEHVIRLSKKKAAKIADTHPDAWVLAADTVVVLDGRILGKPEDKRGARRMLDLLGGRVHEVYTGYCLQNVNRGRLLGDCVVSKVKIKKLSEDETRFYVNTDEPYDKAGGYAVQGIGAFMVEEITGSYTNVVGLPLSRVIRDLQEHGVIKLV